MRLGRSIVDPTDIRDILVKERQWHDNNGRELLVALFYFIIWSNHNP